MQRLTTDIQHQQTTRNQNSRDIKRPATTGFNNRTSTTTTYSEQNMDSQFWDADMSYSHEVASYFPHGDPLSTPTLSTDTFTAFPFPDCQTNNTLNQLNNTMRLPSTPNVVRQAMSLMNVDVEETPFTEHQQKPAHLFHANCSRATYLLQALL